MKIDHLLSSNLLFLYISLTAVDLTGSASLKVALKSKQDAITSLVIFAKSQAEYQRENQLNVLKNHNSTTLNKMEFANLLKKTDSVNLKNITEHLKNASLAKTTKTTANVTAASKITANKISKKKPSPSNSTSANGSVSLSPNVKEIKRTNAQNKVKINSNNRLVPNHTIVNTTNTPHSGNATNSTTNITSNISVLNNSKLGVRK